MVFDLPNTDIFCYFSSENAVRVPSNLWLKAISTSLKLKRDVLILDRPIRVIPELKSSARWQVGDDFLWLAPRALSPILEAVHESSGTYEALKIHLQNYK